MMDSKEKQVCTHEVLENGIHRFVWTASNHNVIDEYLAYIKAIYETHPTGKRLNILIDIRPAMPPVRYAMSEAKKFFSQYPVQPETRAAYLYSSNMLISMMDNLLKMLPVTTTRRFFKEEDEATAINWLTEGE